MLIAATTAFCLLVPHEIFAVDPSHDALHFKWTEVSAAEFRSPDPVYETGSGNACFRRVYIPEEIGDQKVRGIIVWDAEPHYHPNGPRSTIQSKLWRDFAAKHRFGMAELATRPLGLEETIQQIQMIFEDMDRIYGRTECKHACFTFGGTSGTGHDTLQLAAHEPIQGRLIAGIPCSVTFQGSRGTYTFGDRIPLLIMEAGREERERSSAPSTREKVAETVRQGKPFTLAVRLSATHPQFRDDIHSKTSQNRRIAHAMLLSNDLAGVCFQTETAQG